MASAETENRYFARESPNEACRRQQQERFEHEWQGKRQGLAKEQSGCW